MITLCILNPSSHINHIYFGLLCGFWCIFTIFHLVSLCHGYTERLQGFLIVFAIAFHVGKDKTFKLRFSTGSMLVWEYLTDI